MLNNEAQAATLTTVVNSASCANTAAATSAWIDCRGCEGDLEFIVLPGAITGSLTPSFEDATSSGGAGNAAITPNETPAACVANTPVKYTINAKAHRGWVKFIGTIVTGPSLLGVVLQRRPKYTT